jgi:hypothetical protein
LEERRVDAILDFSALIFIWKLSLLLGCDLSVQKDEVDDIISEAIFYAVHIFLIQ